MGVDYTMLRYKGEIHTPTWSNLSGLDSKTIPGMYYLAVDDGSTWGLALIIGVGYMGHGSAAQIIIGPTTGAKYRISNGDNSWTNWKSF